MCLITIYPKQISTEDIEIYKLLKINSKGELVTPYYDFPVSPNGLLYTEGEEEDLVEKDCSTIVKKGYIHCFLELEEAKSTLSVLNSTSSTEKYIIKKGIIVGNTPYYISTWRDEVCAKSVILDMNSYIDETQLAKSI